MHDLVLATRNRGKIGELRLLLAPFVARIRTLDEFPAMPEVEEDAETFAENAIKKARAVTAFTGLSALADDSGLEVDSLGGKPGVLSARFAGEGASDAENNEKLLAEMAEVPEEDRGARFRCVLALCRPDGGCVTFDGALEGRILRERRGSGGFGYDPLFLVTGEGRTLAEMEMAAKNLVSHRAVALQKLADHLAHGRA